MNRTWPLLLLFFIASCAEAPHDLPNAVAAVGHGGMGPDHAFPMNTREAVMACLGTRRNGVEVDVQMTQDGALVCYHAQDLSELTDRTGLVNGFSLENLLTDCRYKEGSGKQTILPLEEVLHAAKENQTVVLDCKLFAAGDWESYLDEYADALAALIMNEAPDCTINIECQVTEFLDRVQSRNTGALIFYYAQDLEKGLAIATSEAYDGITINNDLITGQQIKEAHENDLQVAVFGLDAGDEAEAAAKGADLLQVDEP
ncbi:MAG: glycerophosphodiester phosphodiesterase family protein [Flavobacteriales bacterium]